MTWMFNGAFAFKAYLSKGASACTVDPSEWDLATVTSMSCRSGGTPAFDVDFSNCEVSKFMTAYPCLFHVCDRPCMDHTTAFVSLARGTNGAAP